jgi:hypothetical protein
VRSKSLPGTLIPVLKNLQWAISILHCRREINWGR